MTEISSVAELRQHYDRPLELAVRKDIGLVDRHAREFIARSPFVVVATADAEGWPDASPRGDAPGFVAVEDERHLLMPDRPGNNRLDSFQNLIANPRIGLIFMVPGRQETLRVNGAARILHEDRLLERFAVRGKRARAVVEIAVRQLYFHCGKALIRSALWQPAKWPSLEGLASFGEALTDQIAGLDRAAVEQRLTESYRDRLY